MRRDDSTFRAMKMETVVAAPVGGAVADVACAAGDDMDGGDLLVAIAPASAAAATVG